MEFPRKHTNKIIQEEQGAVAVIVAICLSLIIGMAALVIDFGFAVSAETELQEAADAAALAAANSLNGDLSGMTSGTTAGLTFANLNSHMGSIGPVTVEFGTWLGGAFAGSADPTIIDAVKVSTRTTVNTMFDSSIESGTIETGASAVAQVRGSTCSGPACGVQLPIVLCDTKLEGTPPYCSVRIKVNPTTLQDGGLTSFFSNATANSIGEFVTDPSSIPNVSTVPYPPPSSCYDTNNKMQEPDIVEMNEGTITPVFTKMQDEYFERTNPCRFTGSGPDCTDVDGDGIWEWKTVVLVAHCNGGPVPQGACIRGFANFYVEEVCTTGGYRCQNEGGVTGIKGLYGFAECDGNGDGGPISNMAGVSAISGLVQ